MVVYFVRKFVFPSVQPERFYISPLASLKDEKPLRAKDLLIAVIMFAVSAVYLLAIYDKEIPNLDEGFILTISDRVLMGDMPYKDFFLLMTPGAIYLNALIFHTFGATIIVERATTLILASLASSLFYLLARIGAGYFFSIGGTLIFLAWQFPFWFQASYSWYAVVFSMAAFWVAGLSIPGQKKNKKGLFLVGLLSGMSFAFKQNTGMLTLLGCGVYFAADKVFFAAHAGTDDTGALPVSLSGIKMLRDWLIDFGIILLGFGVPVTVSAWIYLSNDYLFEYLQAIFVTPLLQSKELYHSYPAFSRITDKRIMIYMPHMMIFVTSVFFLYKIIRKNRLEVEDRYLLLLLIATVCVHLTVFPRADFIHVVFTLWPSLVLLSCWGQRLITFVATRWTILSKKVSLSPALVLRCQNLLLASAACFIFAVFVPHRTEKNLSFPRDLEKLPGPRGTMIYGKKGSVRELTEAFDFIREHQRGGTLRHIFSTNPLVYFLASIPNPTPYDYPVGGNVPFNYISELKRIFVVDKRCMILLDERFDKYPIPSDWPEFQSYITSEYRPIFVSSGSRYSILERNKAVDTYD